MKIPTRSSVLPHRSIRSTRSIRSLATIVALCCASVVLVSPSAFAADWPQYRGPQRDGHSPETGIVTSWGDSGPTVLWRTGLGTGYSAISVAGGRAYTMFGDTSDEYAVAFDAASGKQLWKTRLDNDRSDSMGSGPRAAPTIDGKTVFMLGARGKLAALDTATGEPRWTVDLVKRYGAKIPQWGVSTSPVIEHGLVLVDVGGRENFGLLGLKAEDGSLAWASKSDRPGYSTPLTVTIADVEQTLFFTGSELVSVAPKTGKAYWRVPWQTAYDVNAAMPVFVPPNKVFISTSYDKGAALYSVVKSGDGLAAREVWRDRVMQNHFNSSVLVDGYLYGFDNGILKCIDPETGDEQWKTRGFAKGSLIYADGHLILLSERGKLAVAKADPKDYVETASYQVFNAKTWTQPTLADGRLFLRTEKEMIVLDFTDSDRATS